MRRKVLLPAPFAPTKPMMPGSRSTVSESRATTPGYRFVSSRALMSVMREGKGRRTLATYRYVVGGEKVAVRVQQTPKRMRRTEARVTIGHASHHDARRRPSCRCLATARFARHRRKHVGARRRGNARADFARGRGVGVSPERDCAGAGAESVVLARDHHSGFVQSIFRRRRIGRGSRGDRRGIRGVAVQRRRGVGRASRRCATRAAD